ncbi:hypothetical protein [[Phormidium] sp. LEGE 05292]|nr:hypothetical protein [Phormidium sp. LEGE 05292]
MTVIPDFVNVCDSTSKEYGLQCQRQLLTQLTNAIDGEPGT